MLNFTVLKQAGLELKQENTGHRFTREQTGFFTGCTQNYFRISTGRFKSHTAFRQDWITQELDPNLRTVMICGSGRRSSLAVSILKMHGFRDVFNLAGGMTGYEAAGYPMERLANR